MSTVKETRAAKSVKKEAPSRRKKALQGKSLRMQVNNEAFKAKGLYPYWALEEPRRLQELLDAGYRFVTKADVDGIEESDVDVLDFSQLDNAIYFEAAGRDRHTGKPLRQFLMALPLDLHEEDKRRKRARRDERMSQIKAGDRHSAEGQLKSVQHDPISIKERGGAFSKEE